MHPGRPAVRSHWRKPGSGLVREDSRVGTRRVRHAPRGPVASAVLVLALAALLGACSVQPVPTSTPPPDVSARASGTPLVPIQAQLLTHTFKDIKPETASATADVACPQGYTVAGGGLDSPRPSFTPLWDAPTSTTVWRAQIYNAGSEPLTATLSVVCIQLPGLRAQLLTHAFDSIAPGTDTPIVDIRCPYGSVVAGGGVTSTSSTFHIMQSNPGNPASWRTEIHNTGSGDISVSIQVVCLSAPGLTGYVVVHDFDNIAAASATKSVDLSCPQGYTVAGGGLSSGFNTVIEMRDTPLTASSWRAQFYNAGDSTVFSQVQFMCLKVV